MSDIITPNLGLELPDVGADDNNWGNILNRDLQIIDSDTASRDYVDSGLSHALLDDLDDGTGGGGGGGGAAPGVSSFNNRSGDVTLSPTDVTGAGGLSTDGGTVNGSLMVMGAAGLITAHVDAPPTSDEVAIGMPRGHAIAWGPGDGSGVPVAFIRSQIGSIPATLPSLEFTDGGLEVSAPLTLLAGDPTDPLHAVPRQYVDSRTAGVASFNTRTGAVVLTSADVTGALAFTPYNATNPSGYQTAGQVATALAPAGAAVTNFIDNSGFAVNQRGYASGTALAAGAFGHDRWKGGASGGTYTFSAANGPAATITVTVGTLQQVVEGASLDGGTYVLSWTGTAQGRIGGAAYAASPVTAAVTAGTNTTVEFGTGTVGKVKLEVGTTPTAWSAKGARLELANCQRFYQATSVSLQGYQTAGSTLSYTTGLAVQMRATPTLTGATSGGYNASSVSYTAGSPQSFTLNFTAVAAGAAGFSSNVTASADL